VPAAASIDILDHPSLTLVRSVEGGLPAELVDELADAIAPDDARFRYRLIPKSTLAKQRSEAKGRLTTEQGDKLFRVARVWSHARRVWKSDEGARAFLKRPHPLLDDAAPLDLALNTTAGASLVEEILGRLEHGTGV
jgi:putative toxin-antitoxin system antitoxin component (TIGR02293 family)